MWVSATGLTFYPDGSPVSMRVRPVTTTESLGLSTDFRIQVGTQGTQVMSKVFIDKTNVLAPGYILGKGQPGDSYTFRIGAHDYQADVTVTWNSSIDRWEMTSDIFDPSMNTPPLPFPYPAVSTSIDGALTVSKTKGGNTVAKVVIPMNGHAEPNNI